jgi:hypothetical protein
MMYIRTRNCVTRRVINMDVKGWRRRSRPKKRWIDYLRQYTRDMDIIENERRRHAVVTPNEKKKGKHLTNIKHKTNKIILFIKCLIRLRPQHKLY